MGLFPVPTSVKAITPLVGKILMESETHHGQGDETELHLFYNRPTSKAGYAPVSQRLLPLDENWRHKLADVSWPTGNLPEVMGGGTATVWALIREYLFVSLFRACRNPSRARMPVAWRRCNALTRTSTNCWRNSTGSFIVCARVALTRNCSTSSPASRRSA